MSTRLPTSGTVRTVLLITLLLLCTIAAIERGAVWQDEAVLWKDVLSHAPAKWRAYYPIGLHYLNAGRYPEAVEYLSQAAHHQPFHIPIYWDLISAYRNLGDRRSMIDAYQRALAALTVIDEPTPVQRYYALRMRKDLAAVWLEQGNVAEARRLVEETLLLDPSDGEARVLMERIGKDR
jgi:tetratricopeptide (TPR) repeat protein